MRIIAIVAQKGGVGKTTLAAHLGVEAQRAGDGPVMLIDLDPQASLTDWRRERQAAEPTIATAIIKTLAETLTAADEDKFKLAIIDTPPGAKAVIAAAIDAAELILIPAQPSPVDLRAVGPTVDMAEAAGKPLIFVVNRAMQRTRLAAQAAVALSQHGKIAPATIHQRVEYAESMTDGRTAGELHADGNGQREIAELWAYLKAQMSKRGNANMRRIANE